MDDLISRQAAIDAVTRYCTRYDLRELLADIEVIPAVIERKTGRWEFVEDEDWAGGEYYRCSACGWGYSCKMYHEPDEFEHCPHCGAEMGPGKEEKGDS